MKYLRDELENRSVMSADPDIFQNFLDEQGQDFLLLELNAAGERAHLRFTGHYKMQRVVWDCQLIAQSLASKKPNFIEIGEPGCHGVPLTVGLDIACVDMPTIRKMIVMIRQYKKLNFGRHEFGGANA